MHPVGTKCLIVRCPEDSKVRKISEVTAVYPIGDPNATAFGAGKYPVYYVKDSKYPIPECDLAFAGQSVTWVWSISDDFLISCKTKIQPIQDPSFS